MKAVLGLVLLCVACACARSIPSPHGFVDNYVKISKSILSASANANISKLEYMCDTFGPRYCGTENLENAIDWILSTMKEEGLESVQGEVVTNITNWKRGNERLTMLSPRSHPMGVLGLGGSVGTPKEGITAEVLVVSSFDELTEKASEAVGKIVVFNVPFVTYGTTVKYRVIGASSAAAVGAVAALVRSVTPYSLYTLHTGAMYYLNDQKIPSAAITVEDAEMMARMQKRGQKVVLQLYMEASTGDDITSRNVIAELKGSTKPEEIVLLGGHIDSWDVGHGAMDDGGGFFSAWESLTVLSKLVKQGVIPRPNRTIRVVGWVNEEMGARGGEVYADEHKDELANHVLAMESDEGNFMPIGYGFTGTKDDYALVQQIGTVLLGSFGAGNITFNDGEDTDDSPLISAGIPGQSFISEGFGTGRAAYYFNYHHSNADSITALNYDGLRNSVASFAIMSYVVADMPVKLSHYK